MNVKDLASLMAGVNKAMDSELFVVLGDPKAKSQDIERVIVDRLSIDIPLGGGVPRGRVIELYGPESSGKTTISLHIAAAFQKLFKDQAIAFVDYEHAFDPSYARSLGVNTDELALSQPEYMELGLEGIDKLIDTGQFPLIIVDSVAAMLPKAELEGEMGKHMVGVHAKQMSQAMRKLVGKAYKAKTTIIFINQLRDKIGIMFGNPETTTGGNALKFYSSIRVDVRRGAKQTDKDKAVVSNRGRLKVVKNKTYPPYKESEFDIGFGTGLSKESDILDYGVMAGVFEQKGAWYYYNDESEKDPKKSKITLGQGKAKAVEFLQANETFSNEVSTLLLESLV